MIVCTPLRPVHFVILLASTTAALGQTNPTPLSLPVSQDWGSTSFTSIPAGFAVWNGLSGGLVTSQALAEASAPTGDRTSPLLTTTPTNGGTGGAYGYQVSGDAHFAILQSSNATEGVDQLAMALNTLGQTSITLSFDYIAVVLNVRPMGVVVQYRVGTSGGWTTITGSGNAYVESTSTQTTGQVTHVTLSLPAACENQANVQIRWANWRATGSGNSCGTAIDNILVSSSASGPSVTGIAISDGPNYNFGDSPTITVTLSEAPATSATVSVTSGAFATVNVVINAPDVSGSADVTMANAGTYTATASAVTGCVGNASTPSFTVTGVPAPSFAAAGGNTVNDASGNSNGAIDPSESGIQLTIPIINSGTAAATGITGTLTALSSGVSVTTSTRSYPDLAISATGSDALPFVVNGLSGLICGSTITFQLAVTANEGNSTFTVNFTACPPSTTDPYDAPLDYYNTASGTGATLKNSLHNIIDKDYWNGFLSSTNHKVRSYDDAKTALQLLDVDPNNPNNVILIYTGVSVPKAWDGGTTWNREHQWPDSHGINGTLPAYGDLHHLRPCNPTVNSTRGNTSYGIGAGFWDPDHGLACRGRVARSMFYMNTRYNGDTPASLNLILVNGAVNSSINQLGDLAKLVEWNYAYPVDSVERKRNATVFSNTLNPSYYQGNRNPFIDHPEWVWTIYGTSPNDSEMYVGPTPAADGSSTATVNLGSLIVGGVMPAPVTLTLNKTGNNPTTYDVLVSGQAVSDSSGPRKTFVGGAQSRNFTAGLNAPTTTAGLKTGSIVIDNTDLTTAGTGKGVADGNDIVTVNATVLAHSNATFSNSLDQDALTIDVGTYVVGTGTHIANAAVFNRESVAGFTAALDVDSVSGSGDTAQLSVNLTPTSNIAANANAPFTATLDTTALGDYSATYTITVSDENLSGATAGPSLTLTLNGHVVATVAADFNKDRHVDGTDLATLAACKTAAGVPATPACVASDLDSDGDVDSDDFGKFQRCYTGSTLFVTDLSCGN